MNVSARASVVFVMVTVLAFAGNVGDGRLSARADNSEEPRGESLALGGLDPVLLIVGKETKGQPELSVTRDGFRYRFADAANRAEFEKDPERYAIQFHGQCAHMRSARANPDLFTVYKERIYAFGSEECKAAFLEKPQEHAHPVRNVAILVFDGMELLDFAGPGEVFTGAGMGRAFKVYTVAATRDAITSQGLVTMTPRYTFADCPPADVLVIPGGNTRAVAKDKRVRTWIEQSLPQAEVVLSVCTGAFVLANAGLLDGKEATTHWASVLQLRKQFPRITVREKRRFVDNGKIITAAGVSAGIDASLHVVERLLGQETARETARYMEYNLQSTASKYFSCARGS
jgi:putative intracellular protease/amidase/YHS domain-containing protein